MANEELKARILDYVTGFVDLHGYAPSYREIGAAVGVRSTSTVHTYMMSLKQEGRFELPAGRFRAATLNRKVVLPGNTAQRVRVDVADGGVLYMDCAVQREESNEISLPVSGILDATQLKGTVGSVVGCRIEND